MAKVVYNRSTKTFAYKDYEGLTPEQARELADKRKGIADNLRDHRNYNNRSLKQDINDTLEESGVKNSAIGDNYLYKKGPLSGRPIMRNIRNHPLLDDNEKSKLLKNIDASYRSRNSNHDMDLRESNRRSNEASYDVRNKGIKSQVHRYNPILDKNSIQYKS